MAMSPLNLRIWSLDFSDYKAIIGIFRKYPYFMNEDSTVVQCFDYNDLQTLSAETELALTEQMLRNKQSD